MAEVLYAVLKIREVVVEDRCPDVIVGEEALNPLCLEGLCLGLRFNEVDAALKTTLSSNQQGRSQSRMAIPDSGPGEMTKSLEESGGGMERRNLYHNLLERRDVVSKARP